MRRENLLINKKIVVLLPLYFIFMCLNYTQIISAYFNYEPYRFNNYYSPIKLFLVIILLTLLSLQFDKFKKEFSQIVWTILLLYIFIPEGIYYIYNEARISYLILWFILLFIAPHIFELKFSTNFLYDKFLSNDKNLLSLLSILAIGGFLVFFYTYRLNINMSTLILDDIYGTREMLQSYQNGFVGYLKNPLIRVILPILVILSLEQKKYIISFIGIIISLYIFLTTAIKSDLIIIPIIILFYIMRSQKKKSIKIIVSLLILNVISLFEFILFKSYWINDYLIRRVFMVPPMLNKVYFDYYDNNFLFYSKIKLARIINGESDLSIPLYIGENVLLSKNLVANVGIFTEGYVNMGTIGIIFSFVFLALFIQFINKYELPAKYYGLILFFIYVLNTSFFDTLLVTHGLLVLLIFIPFLRNGKE